MPLHIRFATPTDFSTITRLDPRSSEIDPEKIKQKLANQEIIIALKNNQPTGLIRFTYLWSIRPYIDLIWVKPAYRRQGVGSQLLHFLEDYLVAHDHQYLLTSSQKDEPAPQVWHQQQGFKPCGELVGLNLPDSQAAEVFFIKELKNNSQLKKC